MPLEEWLALDLNQYILRDALIEVPEVEEPRRQVHELAGAAVAASIRQASIGDRKRLGALPVIAGVERLIILVDHDADGLMVSEESSTLFNGWTPKTGHISGDVPPELRATQ
jgi:hypothetical protein